MAGPPIPTLSYYNLGQKIKEQTGQMRFPFHGTMEITPHCNLKCVHCFVTHCDWEPGVLTFSEIRRILDEIADQGCLWLLITGGEPLTRPDFLDIYAYAKKKGMIITLFTNGTLITPPIADYLCEWKPRAMEITLYGATEQTYEKITGVPGSYRRCIQGIELLAERHVPLRLKTMAMTINKHEIMQMDEYAQKLGVNFRFDAGLMPRIDQGPEPVDYRITPEEVLELELRFPKRVQGWQDFCHTKVGTHGGNSRYVCSAGRTSFFIDPYGKLSLCLSNRNRQYDLREGSFSEAWNFFLPEILKENVKAGSKCRSCNLLSLCGRCPAWAQLEANDPDAEVEWLCRLAHLRFEAFGTGSPI